METGEWLRVGTVNGMSGGLGGRALLDGRLIGRLAKEGGGRLMYDGRADPRDATVEAPSLGRWDLVVNAAESDPESMERRGLDLWVEVGMDPMPFHFERYDGANSADTGGSWWVCRFQMPATGRPEFRLRRRLLVRSGIENPLDTHEYPLRDESGEHASEVWVVTRPTANGFGVAGSLYRRRSLGKYAHVGDFLIAETVGDEVSDFPGEADRRRVFERIEGSIFTRHKRRTMVLGYSDEDVARMVNASPKWAVSKLSWFGGEKGIRCLAIESELEPFDISAEAHGADYDWLVSPPCGGFAYRLKKLPDGSAAPSWQIIGKNLSGSSVNVTMELVETDLKVPKSLSFYPTSGKMDPWSTLEFCVYRIDEKDDVEYAHFEIKLKSEWGDVRGAPIRLRLHIGDVSIEGLGDVKEPKACYALGSFGKGRGRSLDLKLWRWSFDLPSPHRSSEARLRVFDQDVQVPSGMQRVDVVRWIVSGSNPSSERSDLRNVAAWGTSLGDCREWFLVPVGSKLIGERSLGLRLGEEGCMNSSGVRGALVFFPDCGVVPRHDVELIKSGNEWAASSVCLVEASASGPCSVDVGVSIGDTRETCFVDFADPYRVRLPSRITIDKNGNLSTDANVTNGYDHAVQCVARARGSDAVVFDVGIPPNGAVNLKDAWKRAPSHSCRLAIKVYKDGMKRERASELPNEARSLDCDLVFVPSDPTPWRSIAFIALVLIVLAIPFTGRLQRVRFLDAEIRSADGVVPRFNRATESTLSKLLASQSAKIEEILNRSNAPAGKTSLDPEETKFVYLWASLECERYYKLGKIDPAAPEFDRLRKIEKLMRACTPDEDVEGVTLKHWNSLHGQVVELCRSAR